MKISAYINLILSSIFIKFEKHLFILSVVLCFINYNYIHNDLIYSILYSITFFYFFRFFNKFVILSIYKILSKDKYLKYVFETTSEIYNSRKEKINKLQIKNITITIIFFVILNIYSM